MIKRVALLLIVFFCNSAFANYYCLGKVTHFGSDTWLYVSNGFGVHRLCDTSTDKCKIWASTALAAKMADRELAIYYSHPTITGDQSSGVCSNIGTWVTPQDTVYYLQIY